MFKYIKEIPPTAGFALSARDFLPLPGSLERDFQGYLGAAKAKITYSGTAAFYFILESLKELSSKATVVIPAYVCPLLPIAIHRAGLKIQVCDINQDNFDYDCRKLENICAANKDILAITAVHLAGLPINVNKIKEISQKQGAFLIEDCAQSLGSRYQDGLTGTFGDFSFFSLCRGKGLTIYEGGAAIVNKKEYVCILENKIKQLSRKDIVSELVKIIEVFGYWVFYRPQLFWFIFSLPQEFWKIKGDKIRAAIEYFDFNFPIHKVSAFRQKIGHAQFSRLESEIKKQRQKAAVYLEGLSNTPGIRLVKEEDGCQSSYPYLTLVFQESRRRDAVLHKLRNSGLGGSQIYACAICDYEYLKPILSSGEFPNARFMADHSLTLSTSVFLKEKDMLEIIRIVKLQ